MPASTYPYDSAGHLIPALTARRQAHSRWQLTTLSAGCTQANEIRRNTPQQLAHDQPRPILRYRVCGGRRLRRPSVCEAQAATMIGETDTTLLETVRVPCHGWFGGAPALKGLDPVVCIFIPNHSWRIIQPDLTMRRVQHPVITEAGLDEVQDAEFAEEACHTDQGSTLSWCEIRPEHFCLRLLAPYYVAFVSQAARVADVFHDLPSPKTKRPIFLDTQYTLAPPQLCHLSNPQPTPSCRCYIR